MIGQLQNNFGFQRNSRDEFPQQDLATTSALGFPSVALIKIAEYAGADATALLLTSRGICNWLMNRNLWTILCEVQSPDNGHDPFRAQIWNQHLTFKEQQEKLRLLYQLRDNMREPWKMDRESLPVPIGTDPDIFQHSYMATKSASDNALTYTKRYDGTIGVWSAEGELVRTLPGMGDWNAVIELPSGCFATAVADRVRIWSKTGTRLATLVDPTNHQRSRIWSLEVLPNDGIATKNCEGMKRHWFPNARPFKVFRQHVSCPNLLLSVCPIISEFVPFLDGREVTRFIRTCRSLNAQEVQDRLWKPLCEVQHADNGKDFFRKIFRKENRDLRDLFIMRYRQQERWTVRRSVLTDYREMTEFPCTVTFIKRGNTVEVLSRTGEVVKTLPDMNEWTLMVPLPNGGYATTIKDKLRIWSSTGKLLATLIDPRNRGCRIQSVKAAPNGHIYMEVTHFFANGYRQGARCWIPVSLPTCTERPRTRQCPSLLAVVAAIYFGAVAILYRQS